MKEKPKAQLLAVSHLGAKILRSQTKQIEDINDEKIQTLIDSMVETCIDSRGVGIAAPQVYQDLRLFIMIPCKGRGEKIGKPIAVINPKIISVSKEIKKDWEGCLSIPGIRGLVPRYCSIKVEYTDRNNKKQTKTFKDFTARIFQHEYDHLEGIVFLDKTNSKDLISEKEYQKMMSKK